MARFKTERQEFLLIDPADADEIAGNLLLVLNRHVRAAIAEAKDRRIQTCHAVAGCPGLTEPMAAAVTQRVLARLLAKKIPGVEFSCKRRVDHEAKDGRRYVQAVANIDLAKMGAK